MPRPSTSTVSPGAQAAMSCASSRSRRRSTASAGQPDDRGDREQQPAVGDHRHRRVGGVDAVEHERADQPAVDAADAAGDRDQAAELADEVRDQQHADRRDVVAERREADAEHRDVEQQVGRGADDDRRIARREAASSASSTPGADRLGGRDDAGAHRAPGECARQAAARRARARSRRRRATAGTMPEQDARRAGPAARSRGRCPPRARNVTLARLVSRKNATVRRAMNSFSSPPRRRIHAPSASPPAPPTDSTEFAASSDSPISVLVRQLMRRQNTPRKTST